MNILYIAVHHHVGWGAEYWLSNAFERAGHRVGRFDYRARRKKFKPWALIRHELFGINDAFKPDVVLIQRAEKVPAAITHVFNVPVVFWSTEPLSRRRDVDKLLSAKANLEWVYVHTYSCHSIVEREFPHLLPKSSVMHNAGELELSSGDEPRSRFAIFNRNVSPRRKQWLDACGDLVEVIEGRFGDPYFKDLRSSVVSANIHFADESVDDFETGIFEALACGCVVITETLNPRTVADMGMEDALIQVSSPKQMHAALIELNNNPQKIAAYQQSGQRAIANNRWDARAQQMLEKFSELV